MAADVQREWQACGMSDVPAETPSGDAPVEPYIPFPPFRDWVATEFDRPTLDRFARLLEEARGSATAGRLRAAVETATKWAAVDTGAIEGLYEVDRGFTFTVAVE